MKNAINLLIIFLAFVYLPMSWFMSYLVYNHIHATELMWFLFWVNIPFSLMVSIVAEIAKRLNK